MQAHGGDGAAVAAALGLDPADVLDLSASLNPFAPDVAGLAATHLDALRRYPDPDAATTLLAEGIGVEADRVVLTNGGAEAIALVASIVERGDVVEPEFSLYRRHLDAVSPSAGRWRSNPRNPTGLLAGDGERAAVWDEAFYPLATGRWTRGDDASWRLGSLTKLWACPGLRLGFVIAPDAMSATRVRAVQPQWSVNALALALLVPLLEATDLGVWAESIRRLRVEFRDAVAATGLSVTDTDVNWILVKSPGLRNRLAPYGVVVRDCASFGMPDTFRVALPRPADLDRVLTALSTSVR